MGLKKFLKKAKRVASAPIRTSVDKVTNPGASFDRIKESFRSGNFLDPISTISQELDPGVGLTHELFRQGTGQNLDPASKVNQNLSGALGTRGKGFIGNKPATVLGSIFTGGGFAAGAGGGAGAAGGGLETFPVAGGASGGGVTLGGGAGAAGGAAGAGGAVSNGFNFGNFLGNYGQYLGPLLSGAGQIYGANVAARGAERGIDEIRRQFDINRADNQPWLDTGVNALGGLNRLASGDYSAFMNSPDYKYALEEGLKSVENSAAARGGLYSGNNLRRLQETGSGLASQNLGNYRNQLLSMAGLGQTATNTNIQAGTNAASNIAGLQTNIGDIRGSGIAGAGNELGNAFDTYYGRRYGRKINPYSTYGGV